MKFKGTLIWALILIVLAAFVYLYEIKGGRQRQVAEEEAKKLLPVKTETIDELTLRRPDETIVCRRTGDGWQITEPLNTAGDDAAIDRILQTLARAETSRTVSDSAADLAPFGLDPPQVSVEIRSADGPIETLQLGHKNPTGSHVYVRRDGRPTVYLTDTPLLSEAQMDLFQLRDRRVLSFQQPEVRSLTLERGREQIEIVRDAGGWLLKKPLQVKADTDKIEGMLRKLSSAQVRAYVEEEPKHLSSWGLDRPELSVILTLGPESARKTLQIGDTDDEGRYARDLSREPVFVIPNDLFQELDTDLFDLRDKIVLNFQKDRTAEVELRFDETTIVCRKDTSGQWQLAEPESTAADRWEVESIIGTLAGLKAEEFVDQEPVDLDRYGLSAPRLEAILRDDAGQRIAWLRLGKKTEEGVYACDADGRPVVLVNVTTLTALSPKLENLKKKEAPTP
jgi:hypothetical protein